ncbi:DNA-binding protein [Noviherbaspirillum cavernae]|uniref:DNA-binding protein n=1 Tax=Noviherbaspirillum cavernae TaxID=2320862 RepID=A0A418WYV6_9BURK|nr:DNA-binding protein [Noviherbaspirillum cavernae]RJG05265.1 DNA-binding protein [Noviherbaspirillum cavernae]
MSETLLDTAIAKKLFEASGISVAEWARVRGFSTGLVYQVLEGRRKCLRGQSHQIAIALGLKRGMTLEMDELSRRLIANVTVASTEK